MTWEDLEHSNRLSPNARLIILRDESTWAKSDSPPQSYYFSPPRVESILNEVIFVKETTSSVIWLWNCPPQARVFTCGPQLVALFCSKVLGPLGGGASWLTQSSGADPEDCQQPHCWSHRSTRPSQAWQTGTETNKSVILYVASATHSATAVSSQYARVWYILETITFIIIISSLNAMMKRNGGP